MSPNTMPPSPTLNKLTGLPLAPFKQGDYPNVKWWTKAAWLKRSDDDIADVDASGECLVYCGFPTATHHWLDKVKSTAYLEDSQGTPLSPSDRQAIYHRAHAIWNGFAKAGNIPSGLRTADADYLTKYRHEMEQEFSVLRLCSNHWKTDQVWIFNYPSWLRHKKSGTQKSVVLKKETEDLPVTGVKRKPEDDFNSNATEHKKPKATLAKEDRASAEIPDELESEFTTKEPVSEVVVIRFLTITLQSTSLSQHITKPINPL
jgi:hypothetical protein